METLTRSSRVSTPAIQLGFRRDGQGQPLVSATFVLERPPGPSDRLVPLIQRGVAVFDLAARFGEPDAPPGRDPLVEWTTFELIRYADDGQSAPSVLATMRTSGPFAHAALQANLEGSIAAELLEAFLGAPAPIALIARVAIAAPPTPSTRVRVALGELWVYLDAVAGDDRVFHLRDLLNYLPRLLAENIVRVESGSEQPDAVLATVLKAARFMLSPHDAGEAPADERSEELGPAYRLAAASPGNQTVLASQSPVGNSQEPLECRVPLAELVGPAIEHDRARFLHLVSANGGQLDPVLPARTIRAARGPARAGPMHLASDGRIVSMLSTLNPRPPAATHHLLGTRPELVLNRPQLLALHTLEIFGDHAERRPGPLVDVAEGAMWRDRWNASTAWYVPEFTLVLPDPALPAEQSPFLFDIEPAGHAADGSPGINATITLTLRSNRSAATTAAWRAAGEPALAAVPLSALSVQLGIPFRDEHGATRVEQIIADSIEHNGLLGQEGALLIARFRLLDNWARLAYGALSTPNFQTQPVSVTVSASFEGWRIKRNRIPIVGLKKRRALATHALTPNAITLNTPLAMAVVHPAWHVRPELIDRIDRIQYEWSRFATIKSITAFISCATHGGLYRQQQEGLWQPIGCRPVLQLGEIEYRTYEPIEIAAAAGHAKVYRSLRTPGRYLVIPEIYAVGRYDREHSQRAYQPALLLHSTIDVDVPTNIRCVLAASLQPVLPPFQRSAILAELRQTAHPAPRLEYLPDCGVAPEMRWVAPGDTEIDCIATSTGFDVLCTTDIPGFLTLKSLLEHDGLRGVVTTALPGGIRLESALVLGLGSVTGPFETGPVEMTVLRDGALRTTNRSGRRIALLALASEGVEIARINAVLEPGQSSNHEIDVDADRIDAVYESDGGTERLEETRAYIEDLELGVLFVATADPANAGLAGLEIQTRFLDHDDPEPIVLTTGQREFQRMYLLPLTSFADDPVLEFTVLAVNADGSRRSSPRVWWPVRARGVVIPIAPPA